MKGINHFATQAVMDSKKFSAMAYDTVYHYEVQPIFAAMLVYTGNYNVNRRGADMIEFVMIAKREYRKAHPEMLITGDVSISGMVGDDVIINPRHWADYVCGGTWRK